MGSSKTTYGVMRVVNVTFMTENDERAVGFGFNEKKTPNFFKKIEKDDNFDVREDILKNFNLKQKNSQKNIK